MVEQPANVVNGPGGVTAILISGGYNPDGFLTTPGPGWIFGATIRNCLVRDVVTGVGPGRPLNFNSYTMGGVLGGNVTGNVAYNITGANGANGIYQDTWSVNDVAFTDNHFHNVKNPFYFGFQTNTTQLARDLRISGNAAVCSNEPGAAGFTMACSNGGAASGLQIRGNRFTGPTGVYLSGGIGQVDLSYNQIDTTGAAVTLIGSAATATIQRGNYDRNGAIVGSPAPLRTAEGGTGGLTAAAARSSLQAKEDVYEIALVQPVAAPPVVGPGESWSFVPATANGFDLPIPARYNSVKEVRLVLKTTSPPGSDFKILLSFGNPLLQDALESAHGTYDNTADVWSTPLAGSPTVFVSPGNVVHASFSGSVPLPAGWQANANAAGFFQLRAVCLENKSAWRVDHRYHRPLARRLHSLRHQSLSGGRGRARGPPATIALHPGRALARRTALGNTPLNASTLQRFNASTLQRLP